MTRHNLAQNQTHPNITLAQGTFGPLRQQIRKTLHFSPSAGSGAHAALVLLSTTTPAPAANCDWRHFVVNGDLPLLALTAAKHGVCHHLVVNLLDSTTRSAFSKALGTGSLELLMSAPDGGACEADVMLRAPEHKAVLSVLARFGRAQSDDSNSWWARVLLAANELPKQVATLDSSIGKNHRHNVMILGGGSGLHSTALAIAIERAVTHA